MVPDDPKTAIGSVARIVDLTRTTPPRSRLVPPALKRSLEDMARTDTTLEDIFGHRWDGKPYDKEIAAEWLNSRLGQVNPSNIIVTNGAQNAMLLALQHICADDRIIAVEQYTYHGFLQICRTLGIHAVPVEMDDEGMVPESLEGVCKRTRVPGLYCMPTLQNPTASTMSQQRRNDIADIVLRYNMTILEDDVYGMLAPGGPPPLSSILPHHSWYVNGFGKTVCAGLRIGYLYSSSSKNISSLANDFRTMSTWFPAPLNAALVASWVSSGVAKAILDEIRGIAASRQATFRNILGLPEASTRAGALHAWLRLGSGRNAEATAEDALRLGVRVRPGSVFSANTKGDVDPSASFLRVCLGAPRSSDELESGLARLALACQAREDAGPGPGVAQ